MATLTPRFSFSKPAGTDRITDFRSTFGTALDTLDSTLLRFLGTWSSSTAYNVNDLVVQAGSGYVCVLAHTNQTPPNASYWTALSSAIGAAGGDLTGNYPNPTIGASKVTSSHIVDGTIVDADINASAAIVETKLHLTYVASIQVSDPNGSAITTGEGKAFFRVPSTLNGKALTGVAAHVTTVSSSGLPTVGLRNQAGSEMLSTALTIDASEKDSSTAATPAVINGANATVVTGDEIAIDIDTAGTGAKGLIVELQFS